MFCFDKLFNILKGIVRLPRLFPDDFGEEIGRLATLIDLKGNQFEVLVDKVNDNIYLTRGWAALQNFYNICIGAWIELVYTGMSHFGLIMHDIFHDLIDPLVFNPPVKLVIDKYDLPPYFVDDLPDSPELLAYDHDPTYFQYKYDKLLTHSEVSAGFLVSTTLGIFINKIAVHLESYLIISNLVLSFVML
jgi:hypothetical protein